METDNAFEFTDDAVWPVREGEPIPYEDLVDIAFHPSLPSVSLPADAATRIAIALERIAAALERAYPVGTEEGQANE